MPPPPPSFLAVEWDPQERILEIRYVKDAVLTDEMAGETIAWLDAVLREEGAQLGLLVDGGSVVDASLGYRRAMAAWFRAHARETRMAIHDLGPMVRVMALLFATATGVPVKLAAGREEARAWLKPLPAQ